MTGARPMMRAIALLTVLTLALAACGESRLNPRNWFARSTEQPTLGPIASTIDRRPLVPQVTALTIEPTSTGAIVRAEALMPTAGWWDPELVPENNGRPRDGVMTYRFVAARPRNGLAVEGTGPRTLVAAANLSIYDLEQIREVVVIGAQTTRRARR
jgi:hypothetical protein